MTPTLDPSLASFLHATIHSVWTLELLLLMRRHTYRSWSVEQANRELRATPQLITACLHHLETAGLAVQKDSKWRYAPQTAELALTVDRIAQEFEVRPFSVVNALFPVS